MDKFRATRKLTHLSISPYPVQGLHNLIVAHVAVSFLQRPPQG